MKSPLCYQATEYDCGKVSLINAFMYLFEREEMAPQVIDFASRVTGDGNLGVGDRCRGTSAHSLAFVAAWCNDYVAQAGVPVRCQALCGDAVSMSDGSPLMDGLHGGAVAVCGCRIHVDHYVLMTGVDGSRARIFDPFFEPWPPRRFKIPDQGVAWVSDQPFSHNRLVDRAVLDNPHARAYTLHAASGRDAILMWRTDARTP